MTSKVLRAADELAMLRCGQNLAASGVQQGVIYLSGTLGAGKTTFTRGFLQALGHAGAVKSPTYALVETYDLPQATVHHFDLYRLVDVEELELMGLRDYFHDDALCIVEWPEKGEPLLPAPDLNIVIRLMPHGRQLEFISLTPRGDRMVRELTFGEPGESREQ